MKNYMCVAVTKKIVDKEVFFEKESAYDYFQQRFGNKIGAEQNEKPQKQSGSKKELKKTEENSSYLVWGTNLSAKTLFQEPEINFLTICGIYEVSENYAVIEEQYSYISELLKTDQPIESIYQNLPERFQTKKEALYIGPESTEMKKIVKFIRKIKIQILREHKRAL